MNLNKFIRERLIINSKTKDYGIMTFEGTHADYEVSMPFTIVLATKNTEIEICSAKEYTDAYNEKAYKFYDKDENLVMIIKSQFLSNLFEKTGEVKNQRKINVISPKIYTINGEQFEQMTPIYIKDLSCILNIIK